MPGVTILNSSTLRVTDATVHVQGNELKFWSMNDGEDKSMTYSLFSGNGAFNYSFKLNSGQTLNGSCGTFSNFEIGKRSIFLISDNKVIYSAQGERVICEVFNP